MSRAQYAIPGHVPQSLRRPSRFDRVQRRTRVTVDFFHLDSVDSALVDCVVNLLGTRGLDLIRAMPETIIRAINDQVRKPIVREVNVTDNPDISRDERDYLLPNRPHVSASVSYGRTSLGVRDR